MDISKCDWNDLKIFLIVARSCSPADAAKKLEQSSPLISQRMYALERCLGSSLFCRTPHGVTLSVEGLELLLNVERIDSEIRSIRSRTRVKEALSGRIRVSAKGWLNAHVLTPALIHFQYSHPQTELYMVGGSNAREVDVVIQTHRSDSPNLIERRLLELDYAIYGQADYLRAAGPVRAGGRGHRLVTLTGLESEPEHANWLQSYLGQARTGLFTETSETLLQWCRNGMGLAVLPIAVAHSYPELLQTKLISGTPPSIPVWASYRPDSRYVRHVVALINIAQQTTARNGSPH
jgi:DNA-binding transcriptional LysR family regulator